jgi:hypothetical protein
LIGGCIVGHMQKKTIRYERIGRDAQFGPSFVLISDGTTNRGVVRTRNDRGVLQDNLALMMAALSSGLVGVHRVLLDPESPSRQVPLDISRGIIGLLAARDPACLTVK